MPDFLKDLHPVLQALVAGLFTFWFMAGFCVMMTLDVAVG